MRRRDHAVETIARAWHERRQLVVLGPSLSEEGPESAARRVALSHLEDRLPHAAPARDGADGIRESAFWSRARQFSALFGRTELVAVLRDALRDAGATPGGLERMLASDPPPVLVATSPFSLLPAAYGEFGHAARVVRTQAQQLDGPADPHALYLLFGSLDHPLSASLTSSERMRALDSQHWITQRLRTLSRSHVVLFAGFRADDETLERLLALRPESPQERPACFVVLPEAGSLDRLSLEYDDVTVIESDDYGAGSIDGLLVSVRERRSRMPQRGRSVADDLADEAVDALAARGWAAVRRRIVDVRTVEVLCRRDGDGALVVRGVSGELGEQDLLSVTAQLDADATAVLIADSRISNVARYFASARRDIRLVTRGTVTDLAVDPRPGLVAFLAREEHTRRDGAYVELACYRAWTPTAPAHERERHGLSDYVARWLRDRSGGSLAVLGEPSAGKTWFAARLQVAAARSWLEEEPGCRLPVPIELGAVDVDGALEDAVARAFRDQGYTERSEDAEAADFLARKSRLLLILDGLDELPWETRPDETETFLAGIARYTEHGNKAVVLGRPGYGSQRIEHGIDARYPGGTAMPSFDTVTIAPFDDPQVAEALELRGASPRLREAIRTRRGFHELAHLPGQLEMLANLPAADLDAELAPSIGDLHLAYVRALLARSPDTAPSDVERNLGQLAALAEWMTDRELASCTVADVEEALGGAAAQRDEWRAVLRETPDRRIRFRLTTTRECLAARRLADELADGHWEALSRRIVPAEVRSYLGGFARQRNVDPRTVLRRDTAPTWPLAANALALAATMGFELAGGSWEGLDLRDADLRYADLTGASLRGSDLRGVQFEGGTLTRADLRDTRLHGAVVFETGLVASVRALDPTRIAVGTTEGTLYVLDTATLAIQRALPLASTFRAACAGPSGRIITVAGLDGRIFTVDLATESGFDHIATHPGSLLAVEALEDRAVVAGGTDGSVVALDVDGRVRWITAPSTGYVRALAVATDAGIVALGRSTGEIELLDARDGSEIERTTARHVGGVYSLAYQPETGVLLSGGDDRRLCATDVRTGRNREIRRFDETVLALSAHGESVVVGTRAGSVVLLADPGAGAEPAWTANVGGPALSVAAPGAGRIYTAHGDGALRVLGGRDGTELEAVPLTRGGTERVRWDGLDLRGSTGWSAEWLRFMAERGATTDEAVSVSGS